jgi:pimeloyl-ACP methyl ester carboxylesterase
MTAATKTLDRPRPRVDQRVGPRPARPPGVVAWAWSDGRRALGVGLVAPVVWAAIAAWWTPRGPLTAVEVLAAMAIGLAVGGWSGFATRSRWAMLLAPVAFVAVVELLRLGIDGPTVDRPQFSTYGLMALAVGRGFHGLVGLAPMVLGAALGAGAARGIHTGRRGAPARSSGWTWARRSVAVLGAVLLVALAVVVARPAHTAPIVGPDGEPLAGSVAELTTVSAGGHDLGLMVRGADAEAPVVLFLAGGPGGAERGAMRNHLAALEESFVVATWDQRGTGTSYDELDPTSSLTLEGSVADTIAVTNHLRERFEEDRIYLLGQSWGSTLGVLAVQRAPELYHAFVGTGQMVSQLATDTIFYEDTLAWAEARGDTGLAERLRSIGPPPYDEMLDYETALSYEHQVYPYDHTPNAEGEGGFSENFLVPEYSFTDQVHLLAGFMDTFAALYPQLQDIDFRRTARSLEVPAFFVQGAYEAAGRAEPFAEWYEVLTAPAKDRIVLSTSGHRPLFEQPDEFVRYMEDVVLVQTSQASGR